jgi:GTP-binding protein LepA
VADLLNAVVDQVPPPTGDLSAPGPGAHLRLVYDTYRGVVTYVRVMDGHLSRREKSLMMSTGATHDTLEVGVISPEPNPTDAWARARSAT